MRRDRLSNPRAPQGYTLVELLVVMGIIVLLAGLMLPAIGQVTVAYHEFKTRSIISRLEVALASYHTYFEEYPPSSLSHAQKTLGSTFADQEIGNLESGRCSAILGYCLTGPEGLGWIDESPYGEAEGESWGMLFESEEEAAGAIHDAFRPSKPILYFRAEPGRQRVYDVTDQGELDSSDPPDQGFKSQAHFELLVKIDNNSLPASQQWRRPTGYMLIAPGADRLYGYVKQSTATDTWQAATSVDGDAFCDDICNFRYGG